VLGVILLAAVTSAGLGALIQTSELVFQLVKWVGGLYLIYLGVRLWKMQVTPVPESGATRKSPTQRQLFRQAFIVAVTNPKAIAFITALFPQFIEPTALMAPQFALLAGTFGLLSFLFLLGYALLASRSSRCFLTSHLMRRFNRVSGGLFVGLGSLLITTER
jgi:threonine/homoserine/homoserine lactone efflux protein